MTAKTEDHCQVLCLDLGVTCEVPTRELRPFAAHFVRFPCLAVECSLMHVNPAGEWAVATNAVVCSQVFSYHKRAGCVACCDSVSLCIPLLCFQVGSGLQKQ